MGINKPIEESDECILKGDPLSGVWVKIEWHVIITFDIHELVVET
jgi:hypothetical protein